MQFFVNCPPWSPTPAPSTCPFSTCPFCLLVFFDNCIELGMDKWTKSSFVYWSLPERLWNTENRSPFSWIAEKLGANEIEHLSKNNHCRVLKFNRKDIQYMNWSKSLICLKEIKSTQDGSWYMQFSILGDELNYGKWEKFSSLDGYNTNGAQ